MEIEVVAKNRLQPPKTMFLPQFWKVRSKGCKFFIRFNISYIIRMSFSCYLYALIFYLYVLVCRMSVVCTRMSSVCHLYLPACHPYVTRMCSYVIRMSLVCIRMSSMWHSMSSYVIRMSLVCTRTSSVCHLLVCHPYVTRKYLYVIRMSLEFGYTMNLFPSSKTDTWGNLYTSSTIGVFFLISLGKFILWPLRGSNASRLEPLWGGSLLFTTKFPDISGTHFIDLGRM